MGQQLYCDTARRLIVIYSSVFAYKQWLNCIDSIDTDVLVLKKNSLGSPEQIADYFASRDSVYSAADIVSHGSGGALFLGSTTLTQSNIGIYAPKHGMSVQALTNDGVILLYGCDVTDFRGQRTASADLSGPEALVGEGALESKSVRLKPPPWAWRVYGVSGW